MEKVIIFGASKGGINTFEDLKHRLPHLNVIAFCDNDSNKHRQYLNGRPIISPYELADYSCDVLLIASSYAVEIWSQLYELGYSMDKVETIDVHILNR